MKWPRAVSLTPERYKSLRLGGYWGPEYRLGSSSSLQHLDFESDAYRCWERARYPTGRTAPVGYLAESNLSSQRDS